MKDIIYREDAIDKLNKWESECVWDSWTLKHKGDPKEHIVAPTDVIKNLPSAERTEIIRCKDCKRYDGRPCGLVNWYNGKNDFCSRAEKATVTQIAELFHEAIENTVIAEDEYPHLREKLHRAIDAECERLRGK